MGNETQTDENKPKFIGALFNEEVIQISCGYWHSLVLTKCGHLYSFGYNDEGLLGCGNTTNQLKPIKICGFRYEKIVEICCGASHSLLLTEMGNVVDGMVGDS